MIGPAPFSVATMGLLSFINNDLSNTSIRGLAKLPHHYLRTITLPCELQILFLTLSHKAAAIFLVLFTCIDTDPHTISNQPVMALVSTVLFDADGCLWVDGCPVPGASETLDSLRANGVRCYVVTNNSNNTRQEIAAKLTARGFNNVTEEMIISAGYVTAGYLLKLGFGDRAREVFVVGETGLVRELEQHGINAHGDEAFDPQIAIPALEIPHSYVAVVAALDQTLTYRKLAIATRIIIENDAWLIGTNCDAADPLGHGIFVPDAMPTIMALEGATGRRATILGKPTMHMFEPLKKLDDVSPEMTMMVGDRLNTDMKFAKVIGAKGTLVLTGVTRREEACRDPDLMPDFICESVADVARLVLNQGG
jgi:phosphoglycolate/pyridoxal phosphate phosphatase family enzyme